MASKKSSTQTHYLQSLLGRLRRKTLTITPGNGKALNVGTFKTNEPIPEYTITIVPNVKDDIGMSKERLKSAGGRSYSLVYQFQNFSEKTCKVTVRQK
ncbi:MAG TPA: hypothetical protein VK983_01870 [Candidatus Limnocylindrales bacterium]|nr:hypothetical protein [Candidatus Limnocylindrales bacterium]